MGRYAQYRAPLEGESLVEPSWSRQLELAHENQSVRHAWGNSLTMGGASLGELSAQARRDLITCALQHTRQYANVEAPNAEATNTETPLFVSGHQPELFHPGVWFKNFALDSLAKAAGGVGIHLLIDSDLCRKVAVRTLTGSVEGPRVEMIPFDSPARAMPYEERHIQDETLYRSFAGRVTQAMAPLIGDPLVTDLWTHATRSLSWTNRLGESLSAARHALERDEGSTTLEVPMSAICDTPSFHFFTAELLGRADSFREAYNGALAEYRKAHHLRNAAQPLPDLGEQEDWIETPFWVWSNVDPLRRPLWVRRKSNEVTLSDGAGWQASLTADSDGQFASGAVEQLAELRGAGVKIRSRALATTLYSRMVLADLFLHGIGGAKYDQVTDRIGKKFFGMSPPCHATLSATVRLPLGHPPVRESDRRQIHQRLREQRFHPEQFLENRPNELPSDARYRIDQKQAAIASHKTPENAAERHAVIEKANQELQPLLADERKLLELQLANLEERLRAAALLDSREYAFCLYPAQQLREQLTTLAKI